MAATHYSDTDLNIADHYINPEVLEKQIMFWRSHLDLAIEAMFPPIRLTRDQHVIARQVGNCTDTKIVASRGAGKTWLAALCAFGLATLYPGCLVLVVSSTAQQATLTLAKLKLIADQNENVAREISSTSAKSLVQVSKDKGKCTLKNGSVIESASIDSARGRRAKFIIEDEVALIPTDDLEAVISPIKNYRRDISFNYNFPDFKSKVIAITSAVEKSNDFYSDFVRTAKEMAKGDKESFACALDYRAAAANGITEMEFFLKEKSRIPESTFAMEYESKFIGSSGNSAFPYELSSSCRVLKNVELEQPKNSRSRYVISLDLATSQSSTADNTVVSVIKFNERSDGSFHKKLVYMRSFHGKTLDVIANEIRILYHTRFPNTEKIIYDARGLGDSMSRFFDNEWVDNNGKEHPPLVVDDEPNTNGAAIQMLHPFRAVQTLNQRIYTNLRVALEQRTLELPIDSRIAQQLSAESEEFKYNNEQKAIFIETDALVFEMGNVVGKVGSSGNILYDVPRQNMHKDRYSSLAMGIDYVSELEKDNIKKHTRGTPCIGFADSF